MIRNGFIPLHEPGRITEDGYEKIKVWLNQASISHLRSVNTPVTKTQILCAGEWHDVLETIEEILDMPHESSMEQGERVIARLEAEDAATSPYLPPPSPYHAVSVRTEGTTQLEPITTEELDKRIARLIKKYGNE